MAEIIQCGVTRRDIVKTTTGILGASALAGVNIPSVHAGEDNTIRIALIGCGGRGTGAAVNALTVNNGPSKLVAMADVFDEKLKASYDQIKGKFPEKVEVPDEHKFIDFEGYKKAMDCLKPGDIALLATPPAFRWVHFTYAIEKGLNVFMEKPVSVDGPSSRKMFVLAEQAAAKNLKVGVGLMCRHCDARGELFRRIKEGEMGDLTLLRAYRMAGPTAWAFAKKKPADGPSELLYQIREFHAFLWASGGSFSDFLIHNIDECCWMKDAWPVEAKASGGRHYRADYVDQNFDTYSVEYTFGDGAKLYLEGRCMTGCHQEFASYAHGTKASAIVSFSGHAPARCKMYKGQQLGKKDAEIWRYGKAEPSPYDLEWEHLIDAIRKDKPYNEAKRGTEASLVTVMGRLAAHTGKVWTYDKTLNHEHEFAPDIDKLTMSSASPLVAAADGSYPIPEPGIKTKREY